MKRIYKKPRVKKIRIPKPVSPLKPKRPKRGDLKKIYKDLHTTDIDQRVNALAKAMTWYDQAMAYLAYKQDGMFNRVQLRCKAQAEDSRLKGIKSTVSVAKEACFTVALKFYELMTTSYKPPKLAPLLRKLKSKTSTLKVHQHNMQKKHGKFLQLLDDALRVKLGVDKLNSTYRIKQHNISDCHVVLDRKFVMDLRRLTRKHGLLSAIVELLPILSEAMATYPEVDNNGNKTGKYKVDYGDRYKAVIQLIHNLNSYAQKEYAVRSIVRRKKPPTTKTITSE